MLGVLIRGRLECLPAEHFPQDRASAVSSQSGKEAGAELGQSASRGQGGRGVIYNFFITRWATEAVWQWRRWQDVGVSETATETPEEQTFFSTQRK